MKADVVMWIEDRRVEITKAMALRQLMKIQPSQERSATYPGMTEQEVVEAIKKDVTQQGSDKVIKQDQKDIDDLDTDDEVDHPAPRGGGGKNVR